MYEELMRPILTLSLKGTILWEQCTPKSLDATYKGIWMSVRKIGDKKARLYIMDEDGLGTDFVDESSWKIFCLANSQNYHRHDHSRGDYKPVYDLHKQNEFLRKVSLQFG